MKEKIPLTPLPAPSAAIAVEAQEADLTTPEEAAGVAIGPPLDNPGAEPAGLPPIGVRGQKWNATPTTTGITMINTPIVMSPP